MQKDAHNRSALRGEAHVKKRESATVPMFILGQYHVSRKNLLKPVEITAKHIVFEKRVMLRRADANNSLLSGGSGGQSP